ncbi:MAG: diguanylate cyclase [bacterium]|nr:diguanylate cyclase [bacterium]
MPNTPHWSRECAVAITVTDAHGTIIEMNDRAAQVFAKDGGRTLIGSSVLDCHPESSRSMVAKQLHGGITNAYTIEKGGVKKLIYQTPWHRDGKFAGLIEFSMEIPRDLPHFNRDLPKTNA